MNEADHLVVGALTLDAGCDWVEERLGVRPQPGGQHVKMGTHNALLSLGPRLYLEVIAIDPAGSAPARARWFDLDEPRMKAALANGSEAAKKSDFIVYPDAPHAFHADYRPSYRKDDAADGWNRCLAWFRKHGVA